MNDCEQARRAPITNVDVRLEPFGISRGFEPNYLYLLHRERCGRALAGIGLRAREHQDTYVRTFIFDNQYFRPSKLLHRAGASLPAWRCSDTGQEGQQTTHESTLGGRAVGLEILFDRPVEPASDSFWVGFQLTRPAELVVCKGQRFMGLVSTGHFQPSESLDSCDVVAAGPSLERPQIQLFYID